MVKATKKKQQQRPRRTRVRKRVRVARPAVSYSNAKTTTVASSSRMPRNPILRKFWAALADPFSSSSYGARVPDEYRLPTEVVTLRGRVQWNSTSPQINVFTPMPMISALAWSTGTSTPALSTASGSGQTGTLQVNTTVGKICTVPYWSPIEPQAFKANYSAFRVVGWGLRLRNTTKASDVAGDVAMALLPCSKYAPVELLPALDVGNTVANPGSAWPGLTDAFCLPASTYNSNAGPNFGTPIMSNLEACPLCEVFSSAEVAQSGGVTIKPSVHSPSAWNFRSTIERSTGPHAYCYATQGGDATLGNSAVTNMDPLLLEGENNVVIYTPLNTTTQLYEVEVIYHLEVVARVGSTYPLGGSSQSEMSPVVPQPEFQKTWLSAVSQPWVEFAKHEGQRLFGNVVQALPGMMTKMALSGFA